MAPGTESPWGSGWEAKKELVSAGMLASLMGLLWGGETGPSWVEPSARQTGLLWVCSLVMQWESTLGVKSASLLAKE